MSDMPQPQGHLMGQLAAFLDAEGIAYAITQNGQELAVDYASAGESAGLLFAETPGILHAFIRFPGSALPEGNNGATLIAWLDKSMPIPPIYLHARYILSDLREIGLYVRMYMPKTFSAANVGDTVDLARYTLARINELWKR